MATSPTTSNAPLTDRSGARDVSDELAHLAKEVTDSGKQLYETGHERLLAEIDHLKTKLGEMGDQAVRRSEVSLHAVTEAVASRPLLSLCGAFAAGVALSLLLGGRRSS